MKEGHLMKSRYKPFSDSLLEIPFYSCYSLDRPTVLACAGLRFQCHALYSRHGHEARTKRKCVRLR